MNKIHGSYSKYFHSVIYNVFSDAMWQRLCNSETIYSEVPHQLMGDGCPVKAAIALKADYLSEEKKKQQ